MSSESEDDGDGEAEDHENDDGSDAEPSRVGRSHDTDCEHGVSDRESVTGIRSNDVPDVVAARDRVVGTLLKFTRALAQAGVEVPANASVDGARALVEIGFGDRERVRVALKATLVSRRADIETFDRLFAMFWKRLADDLQGAEGGGADNRENVGEFTPITGDSTSQDLPEAASEGNEPDTTTRASNWRPATGSTDEVSEDDPIRTTRYSPTGSPERMAIPASALTERESLDRAIGRLTRALATVQGRRWDAGRGDHADARRALRRSFSTGGTVVSIPRRERKSSGVRCVLFVDVSRSVLDSIDRAFLIRFLRAVTTQWHGTRTFLFDTSLREVSRELAAPSPEATLKAFGRAETEWGGGTRIANAISTIHHTFPDAIDRRTTVFAISDGLEMGEIDALEAEMSWLSRRARLVLWGNPLASAPEYEPTARGMAVSMPYVDGLFAFRNVDDIDEIARQLDRRGTDAIGYEYDPRRRVHD